MVAGISSPETSTSQTPLDMSRLSTPALSQPLRGSSKPSQKSHANQIELRDPRIKSFPASRARLSRRSGEHSPGAICVGARNSRNTRTRNITRNVTSVELCISVQHFLRVIFIRVRKSFVSITQSEEASSSHRAASLCSQIQNLHA